MSKIFTASMFLFMSLFLSSQAADSIEPNADFIDASGLRPPTLEEKTWMEKRFQRVKKIRLNRMALDRINHERQTKGKRTLSPTEVGMVPQGGEMVFDTGTRNRTGFTENTTDALPALEEIFLPGTVDNSQSPAFPPVGNQLTSGSCTAWAVTYYQFTYENNLVRGWTANTGDKSKIFSPKWTYNLINGGYNNGSSISSAYRLESDNGVCTWAEFPYDGNYKAWCLKGSAWRNAINFRPKEYGIIPYTYDDNGATYINNIKTQLANGHVVVIDTYIGSWVKIYFKDDPSTADDDAFVGQYGPSYMNNTWNGAHAMAIVGYNDSLWADINGNGIVEPAEKGAFKVANSHGTATGNAGFYWVPYDACRQVSTVPSTASWPKKDRVGNIFYDAYTITVNSDYKPTMVAEVTLNTSHRGDFALSLGTSTTRDSVPIPAGKPSALNYSGGDFSFDGTTTACDSTFFFDFSDWTPTNTMNTRWYLDMNMFYSSSAILKGYNLYKVTDLGDTKVSAYSDVPKTVTYDAGDVYAWVEYSDSSLPPTNQPPVAQDQNVTDDENVQLPILLNATDADRNACHYSIVSQPAHGKLSGSPPNMIYKPDPYYYGSDSFTFQANDGAADSNVGTVSIAVLETRNCLSVFENVPISFTLAGDVWAPDEGTITVVANPQRGQLTGQSPDFTYAKDGGYTGNDNFTFYWSNGTTSSDVIPMTLLGVSGRPAYSWGSDYSFEQFSHLYTSYDTYGLQCIPVRSEALTDIIAVAAGCDYGIALKSNGTVWTWGHNVNASWDDNNATEHKVPVQISGISDVVAVATGYNIGMALKSDKTVWTWGQNVCGQIGDGTFNDRVLPVQVKGLSDVIAIASGYYCCFALKSNGTIFAWGYNYNGRLGDGTTTTRITPVQVKGISGAVSIATGMGFGLALKSDGTVMSWGDNSGGQLGDGTTTQNPTPKIVAGLPKISSIAACYGTSLAIASDGSIWAWGDNGDGQYGNDTTTASLVPIQAQSAPHPGDPKFVSMAGGYRHCLGLKSDGSAWAWGSNFCGQLGDGTTQQRTTPVQVLGLKKVKSLSASFWGYSSLATLNPIDSPVITSPLTATGAVGVDFSYTIMTTYPATSFTASALPSGLVLDAGTGLISGQSRDTGATDIKITATNGDGWDTKTLALTIYTPQQKWRFDNGLPTGGTGLGADAADPAGDGVSNLLKYALGLRSFTPATSVSLPMIQVNDGHLAIQFMRHLAAIDITYEIQVSDDCKRWLTLATWAPGAMLWTINPGSTGATILPETNGMVTAIDNEKIANHDRRFLRLKVTAP